MVGLDLLMLREGAGSCLEVDQNYTGVLEVAVHQLT